MQGDPPYRTRPLFERPSCTPRRDHVRAGNPKSNDESSNQTQSGKHIETRIRNARCGSAMTAVELSDRLYHNEEVARRHLEKIRWPDGQPSCPHCGVVDRARPLGGTSMGPGWFYCEACKDKFTVRTGTVYQRSHIPLHKWLMAFQLVSSSEKCISAGQLSHMLGITYKSARFMLHRIGPAPNSH